jgi:hypothetical protein
MSKGIEWLNQTLTSIYVSFLLFNILIVNFIKNEIKINYILL